MPHFRTSSILARALRASEKSAFCTEQVTASTPEGDALSQFFPSGNTTNRVRVSGVTRVCIVLTTHNKNNRRFSPPQRVEVQWVIKRVAPQSTTKCPPIHHKMPPNPPHAGCKMSPNLNTKTPTITPAWGNKNPHGFGWGLRLGLLDGVVVRVARWRVQFFGFA